MRRIAVLLRNAVGAYAEWTVNAGANTIRAAATTADGCPNLDYLDGPA
ncbi:hypothetical protein QMK19_19180 [Streptomyces sp. H10-C2]|nr:MULTISPECIES: hypothetical protein [unclassified Streptomyces]MDJ0346229.1 hypothetical protein [Streptomyces sp. PH10-H1]MDJ0371744.1 hypothetical protein [Streptomyces sp. H10-C2]